MSIKRMSAVWEQSKHKGSSLLLMLALADNANDLGFCWPGYNHLAGKIRMSRKQTIRLTALCADSGELWVMNRDNQRSNVYIVTVGLTAEELAQAVEQAHKYNATSTMGSDILSLPPQVLGVVPEADKVIGTRCPYVVSTGDTAKALGRDTAKALGRDIAMSPDPSLPVIEPSEKNGSEIQEPERSEWAKILRNLEGAMAQATYNQHFLGAQAERLDGRLVITVRHPLSVPMLDKRLRPVVERAVCSATQEPLAVEFRAAS